MTAAAAPRPTRAVCADDDYPGGVAGCCTGAGCEVHVARAAMIHAAHSTLIGGSHMLLDSSGCRSQDSFTCEYQIRSATATMSSEIAEIRR